MINRIRTRLEYRFATYVGLGMLLFSILVGTATYHHFSVNEIENALALEQQLVQTVIAQAGVGVYANNEMISEEVLQGLLAAPVILAASIESNEQFRMIKSKQPGLDFSSAMLHPLPSPVNSSEMIGLLKIVVDKRAIQNEATFKALYYTGGLIAQLFFTTVMLIILARHLLSKPISLLAHQMVALQPGECNRLVIERSHALDEIGLLSRSANSWLSTTENAIKQMAELNHALQLEKADAERANQIKGEFLAKMSHEIRTPLGGLIGMLEVLSRTELNPRQRDILHVTVNTSNILLDILTNILDFSRIEAGKLTIEQNIFSVSRLVDEVGNLFLHQATAKGISFSWQVDRHMPPYLSGDVLRLRQILTNLVSNAIKFTQQGFVRLHVQSDGAVAENGARAILFQIEDSGCGIAQQDQKRIFEMFVQADSSTSRNAAGIGLGLSICKQLVEAMEGKITVSSRQGKGAVFSVRIPFFLGKESETMTQHPILPPLSLLVVEDEVVNQMVIRYLLESDGHTVTMAENGFAALQLLQHIPFDAILMDLHMPDMDGFTTTSRIRSWSEPIARIAILAMTADITQSSHDKAMQAGCNAVLTKPLEMPILRDKLARALALQLPDPFCAMPGEAPSVHAVGNLAPEEKINHENVLDMTKAGLLQQAIGEDKIRILLNKFREEEQRVCLEMATCLETNNHPMLAQLSHGLKGAAGFMGMEHLYLLSSQINAVAKKQDHMADCQQLSSQIKRCSELVNTSCDQFEQLLATPQ
ncbi:MAG: response regulator [Magnetococcales bacterium]|nr:response regulator [Magnetococcales bacterium]